jgi:hypothetical protein
MSRVSVLPRSRVAAAALGSAHLQLPSSSLAAAMGDAAQAHDAACAPPADAPDAAAWCFPLTALPDTALLALVAALQPRATGVACCVCRAWCATLSAPHLWRVLDCSAPPPPHGVYEASRSVAAASGAPQPLLRAAALRAAAAKAGGSLKCITLGSLTHWRALPALVRDNAATLRRVLLPHDLSSMPSLGPFPQPAAFAADVAALAAALAACPGLTRVEVPGRFALMCSDAPPDDDDDDDAAAADDEGLDAAAAAAADPWAVLRALTDAHAAVRCVDVAVAGGTHLEPTQRLLPPDEAWCARLAAAAPEARRLRLSNELSAAALAPLCGSSSSAAGGDDSAGVGRALRVLELYAAHTPTRAPAPATELLPLSDALRERCAVRVVDVHIGISSNDDVATADKVACAALAGACAARRAVALHWTGASGVTACVADALAGATRRRGGGAVLGVLCAREPCALHALGGGGASRLFVRLRDEQAHAAVAGHLPGSVRDLHLCDANAEVLRAPGYRYGAPSSAAMLAALPARAPRLRALSLCCTHLGAERTAALAATLAALLALNELHLRAVRGTDVGAFAAPLAAHPCLTSLRVSFIRDDGAVALATALTGHATLRSLALTFSADAADVVAAGAAPFAALKAAAPSALRSLTLRYFFGRSTRFPFAPAPWPQAADEDSEAEAAAEDDDDDAPARAARALPPLSGEQAALDAALRALGGARCAAPDGASPEDSAEGRAIQFFGCCSGALDEVLL